MSTTVFVPLTLNRFPKDIKDKIMEYAILSHRPMERVIINLIMQPWLTNYQDELKNTEEVLRRELATIKEHEGEKQAKRFYSRSKLKKLDEHRSKLKNKELLKNEKI